MDCFTVFYYKTYEDVHSWKAAPESRTIKASDEDGAKKIFKQRFPKYVLLRILQSNKYRKVEQT